MEVGPTSRWATQEGHVDPEHGQQRKVAKNKTKQNKKVKEREEGEKEYILIEYMAIFTILFRKKIFFFEETWQRVHKKQLWTDLKDSLDTELNTEVN